jgi:excisionase family DNA binding protein
LTFPEEIPLTVRQAAVFLGVSPQTVYLWVERKQIPHLRVMGRNIRFLKTELELFGATFRQETADGWPKERGRLTGCLPYLLVMLVMSGSRFPCSLTGAVDTHPQPGGGKQTERFHLNGGI